jgi:hypothetical protein
MKKFLKNFEEKAQRVIIISTTLFFIFLLIKLCPFGESLPWFMVFATLYWHYILYIGILWLMATKKYFKSIFSSEY